MLFGCCPIPAAESSDFSTVRRASGPPPSLPFPIRVPLPRASGREGTQSKATQSTRGVPARGAACPISTGRGTRRVPLVLVLGRGVSGLYGPRDAARPVSSGFSGNGSKGRTAVVRNEVARVAQQQRLILPRARRGRVSQGLQGRSHDGGNGMAPRGSRRARMAQGAVGGREWLKGRGGFGAIPGMCARGPGAATPAPSGQGGGTS